MNKNNEILTPKNKKNKNIVIEKVTVQKLKKGGKVSNSKSGLPPRMSRKDM